MKTYKRGRHRWRVGSNDLGHFDEIVTEFMHAEMMDDDYCFLVLCGHRIELHRQNGEWMAKFQDTDKELKP